MHTPYPGIGPPVLTARLKGGEVSCAARSSRGRAAGGSTLFDLAPFQSPGGSCIRGSANYTKHNKGVLAGTSLKNATRIRTERL